MQVKEIMNKAFAIDHDVSLKEAAKLMGSKDIGSLVVVKGEKITGIVTERDVVRNIMQLEKKISSVMNKQTITIDEEEDIDNAAILMSKNKIKRLPVTDNEQNLKGIITSTDLIAHSDELNEDFLLD
jgi:CBS domain-containing protein